MTESVSLTEMAPVAANIAGGLQELPQFLMPLKFLVRFLLPPGGIAAVAKITESVWKGEYENVPSFHHLAARITGSTVWPGIENIKLKSASLADSFVIGLEIR